MSKKLTPLEAAKELVDIAYGKVRSGWEDKKLERHILDLGNIVETALKKQITEDNEHPRKKGFRQQDNRLRLAYQEMGIYSKNEEVPQELRGKPYGDIIGIIPKDEERRWDLYLMFNMLLNRPIHDREWDKDKKCFIEYPCLLQELENRGYDVKSIYFEISKKDKRKKYVPYKTYLYCRENLNFDSKTDQKKLKTLEIIVKNFSPYNMENLDNGKVRIWLSNNRFVDLPKEEFDLLKEVCYEIN